MIRKILCILLPAVLCGTHARAYEFYGSFKPSDMVVVNKVLETLGLNASEIVNLFGNADSLKKAQEDFREHQCKQCPSTQTTQQLVPPPLQNLPPPPLQNMPQQQGLLPPPPLQNMPQQQGLLPPPPLQNRPQQQGLLPPPPLQNMPQQNLLPPIPQVTASKEEDLVVGQTEEEFLKNLLAKKEEILKQTETKDTGSRIEYSDLLDVIEKQKEELKAARNKNPKGQDGAKAALNKEPRKKAGEWFSDKIKEFDLSGLSDKEQKDFVDALVDAFKRAISDLSQKIESFFGNDTELENFIKKEDERILNKLNALETLGFTGTPQKITDLKGSGAKKLEEKISEGLVKNLDAKAQSIQNSPANTEEIENSFAGVVKNLYNNKRILAKHREAQKSKLDSHARAAYKFVKEKAEQERKEEKLIQFLDKLDSSEEVREDFFTPQELAFVMETMTDVNKKKSFDLKRSKRNLEKKSQKSVIENKGSNGPEYSKEGLVKLGDAINKPKEGITPSKVSEQIKAPEDKKDDLNKPKEASSTITPPPKVSEKAPEEEVKKVEAHKIEETGSPPQSIIEEKKTQKKGWSAEAGSALTTLKKMKGKFL